MPGFNTDKTTWASGGEFSVFQATYTYIPAKNEPRTASPRTGIWAYWMRRLANPVGWLSFQMTQLYGWLAEKGWDD